MLLFCLGLTAWAADRSVTVYYATNRDASLRLPTPGFGWHDAEALTWGAVTVSERGLRLPGQDRQLQPAIPERFTAGATLDLTFAPDRPVVVVVHGYNTSWTWAAREAAQLAMDLADQGTPITPLLYSWPSGGLTRYPADENVAMRSVPRFEEFLRATLDRAGETPVHLVAHSMGARLTAVALDDLWGDRATAPLRGLDAIVLASADVDRLEFRERYLDALDAASTRATLYVTRNDRALSLSQRLHGGYPRLGQIGMDRPSDLVEVVDTGPLDRGTTRHATFRESLDALRDLAGVLQGRPAPERGLVAGEGCWTFAP